MTTRSYWGDALIVMSPTRATEVLLRSALIESARHDIILTCAPLYIYIYIHGRASIYSGAHVNILARHVYIFGRATR